MARTPLRLLIVTLLGSAALVTGWGSEARACSCEPRTDLDLMSEQELIVRGEVLEETERDDGSVLRTFRVDEAIRGAAPAVIELIAEPWCAYPPDLDGDAIMMRHRVGERWNVTEGCGFPNVSEDRITAMFGPLPEPTGQGPPAAVCLLYTSDAADE